MILGKVVLLPFPFDDLSAAKVRASLCLTKPIGPHRLPPEEPVLSRPQPIGQPLSIPDRMPFGVVVEVHIDVAPTLPEAADALRPRVQFAIAETDPPLA